MLFLFLMEVVLLWIAFRNFCEFAASTASASFNLERFTVPRDFFDSGILIFFASLSRPLDLLSLAADVARF